jgi:streptomycin 6-kinase
MISISEDFSKRIQATFGDAGADWIRCLPDFLERVQERWSLTIQPPFEPLSYNYVAPARRADGSEIVVKAGVPNKELYMEIDALSHFDGGGTVRLLEADPQWGVLLLERLMPGEALVNFEDDDWTTAIAAHVMHQLWKPPPEQHRFPSISDWAKGFIRLRDTFGGGTGPFPRKLLEAAESLYIDLIATGSDDVLLHGDLHHWNILSAQREPWLAVDPKGVIGEPAYEVGAWLRNPYTHIFSWREPERIMIRRVDQLSERLGFERERLIGWGLAQAVLSAWWGYEDGDDGWDFGLRLAEVFAYLQR